MNDPKPVITLAELLGESPPSNWGRWGDDDEIGALNHLTSVEVLAGIRSVVTGETFTLGLHMGRIESPGDPMWPGREPLQRRNVLDESSWERHDAPVYPGGLHYADDTVAMYLQGSTHVDALGHTWYDGRLWNGYDARSTVGAMQKASVLPIAERGIVGRAILIDMARHRGKQHLEMGETFSHIDLIEAAQRQGAVIEKRDIILIRTGLMAHWYDLDDPETYYADYREPGLTYSPELVEWFHEMETPALVTDTVSNEATVDPESGVTSPLHLALMRNLGIVMNELAWLEDIAEVCASDGRWSMLYSAGPLKIVQGTGAPVNPVVIR